MEDDDEEVGGDNDDDDESSGGAMHRSVAPSAMMPGCSAALSSSHTERSDPSGARKAEGVDDEDDKDEDENEAADASLLVFECGSINSSHCETNKQFHKQKTHHQITRVCETRMDQGKRSFREIHD